MPRLQDRISTLPLLLPESLRGTLRRLRKAITPQSAFQLEEVIGWLLTLKGRGVLFGFPEDIERFGKNSLAILKHDIHDDLDRAVEMARVEHAHDIHGLYFMMGPHVLNRSFYGAERTWTQLRLIQSLGHRIGLHLDPFVALKQGGIHEFAARTVAEFAAQGIVLRYGNCHGDRKYEALGVRVTDYFAELVSKQPPLSGPLAEKMSTHLGKYFLKHMADAYELSYWVEGRVFRAGVPQQRALYVTDNTGCIRIAAKGLSSKPFELDESFVAASAEALSSTHSIILLHPQWYSSSKS